MKRILATILLTGCLCRALIAQTEEDPVGQWLFQIEQQIRQDPASSDRIIRRIGSMRDPDLLRRIQRRWEEIQVDEQSNSQQLALYEIDMWVSFQTGRFDHLTQTLLSSGLGDDRPDRWVELANRLTDVGAFDQAQIAWDELENSSLVTYQCRALEGKARSHLQRGIDQLKSASPTPPSPGTSFLEAVNHVQSLLHRQACHQDPDIILKTLLELVHYAPSSFEFLELLDSSIPSNAPIRETEEWTDLRYNLAVQENRWSEARYLIGLRIDGSSGEETDGTLQWRMAHLELAEGETDMAHLQLNALRQQTEADRFNDLTADLSLWNQRSSLDASWYSRFMLLPALHSDSLRQNLRAHLEELNPRDAGLLLYRLHQRSGHRLEPWYIDSIRETVERMDPSDPLVPYLHWAILQQTAWFLAETPESDETKFRDELQNYLNRYPTHPIYEFVSNERMPGS